MYNPLSKKWDSIEWVLTDVDDTLTWQGKLPKQTLAALENLQERNIKIIAVTGACAGWCDHIAQLWPVDAVIGENGAFTIEKHKRGVTLSTSIPLDTMQTNQQRLKAQIHTILKCYPDIHFTLDQAYRLCDVAIDIGQNREPVHSDIVEAVMLILFFFLLLTSIHLIELWSINKLQRCNKTCASLHKPWC